MTLYSIFEKPQAKAAKHRGPVAIADRFSWLAMLVPPLFALLHGLWLLLVFWIALVIGLGYAARIIGPDAAVALYCLVALFLGFGKRRHELAGVNASKQRAALEAYSPSVLNFALAATGIASVATYCAYTLDPGTRALFGSQWLWVTTVHPLFGVIRFLQLVAGRPKAESPTQEILRDTKPDFGALAAD